MPRAGPATTGAGHDRRNSGRLISFYFVTHSVCFVQSADDDDILDPSIGQ